MQFLLEQIEYNAAYDHFADQGIIDFNYEELESQLLAAAAGC